MAAATLDQLAQLARDYKSRSTPGNCYQDGFQCLTWWSDYPGLRLAHGVCTGRGGLVLGVRYGHAWVEARLFGRDFCVDATGMWPREYYYQLGSVGDVVRYDARRACRLALKHEHYGSWKPSHTEANAAAEKLSQS